MKLSSENVLRNSIKILEVDKSLALSELKEIDGAILNNKDTFIEISKNFKELVQNSVFIPEDIMGNDVENIRLFISEFNDLHESLNNDLTKVIDLINRRQKLLSSIEYKKMQLSDMNKSLKKIEATKKEITVKSITHVKVTTPVKEFVIKNKVRELKTTGKLYDIFIAYRRNSAGDFANHLYTSLESEGYHPFIDIIDIPNTINRDTDEWRAVRDQALLSSRYFFLILTKGCQSSKELKSEIELAFSKTGINKILFKNESLPNDFILECGEVTINLGKQQYIAFDSKESLFRFALDELEKYLEK